MTDLAATGGLDAATINGKPLKQAAAAASLDVASVQQWQPSGVIGPFGLPLGMPQSGSPTPQPRRTYEASLFRI